MGLAMIALAATTPCIAHAQDDDVTALVMAQPLAVTLEMRRDDVRTGSAVAAFVRVENLARDPMHDIEVAILFDETTISERGGSLGNLHHLEGGGASTVSRVLQPHAAGSYVIVARATGITSTGTFVEAESNAVILTVR